MPERSLGLAKECDIIHPSCGLDDILDGVSPPVGSITRDTLEAYACQFGQPQTRNILYLPCKLKSS